jgi:hypothetical protein
VICSRHNVARTSPDTTLKIARRCARSNCAISASVRDLPVYVCAAHAFKAAQELADTEDDGDNDTINAEQTISTNARSMRGTAIAIDESPGGRVTRLARGSNNDANIAAFCCTRQCVELPFETTNDTNVAFAQQGYSVVKEPLVRS